MPPFDTFYVTFFDIDGDSITDTGGSGTTASVFELNSVWGAVGRTIDPSATLTGGQFLPSGQLFALAQNPVNVDTDFATDPQTVPVPAQSRPAVAAFELGSVNQFRLLLGGRSAVTWQQSDRGYCFAFVQPDLGAACPPPTPPPPHPPPVSPVPSPPPPVTPPPPPPTPHPPPAPLQPGQSWGGYLVELNFTYPYTKSRIEVPSVQTPVGTKTNSRVPGIIADLNKDTIPDLLTDTFIYRNTAGNTFQNIQSTRIGTTVSDTFTSIVAVDVDQDTNVDVVVAYETDQGTPLAQKGIKVFRNPGGASIGIFSSVVPSYIGTQYQTQSVDVADVDGDGLVDIIAANENQVNEIYVNLGGGSFAPQKDAVPLGTSTDNTVAIKVLSASASQVDIVVINRTLWPASRRCGLPLESDAHAQTSLGSGLALCLHGLSLPPCIAPRSRMTPLPTVAGNAANRIVRFSVSNRVMTLLTDQTIGTETDDSRDVVLADVNGDGQLDVIVANSLTTNKVYINPGNNVWSSVAATNLDSANDDSRSVTVGAIQGLATGNVAIFVGNAGQTNKVFVVAPSTGTFTSAGSANIGAETDDTRSVSVSDVNGDGFLDVVATPGVGAPKVYLNPTTGTLSALLTGFASVTPTIAGGGGLNPASALALGDLDSNGYLDVISGNKMYLNPGAGASAGVFSSVTPKGFAGLDDDVTAIAVGDLNADGANDVVFGTSEGLQVGTTSATKHTNANTPP